VIGAASRKRYDFRKLVRRAHPEMTREQELSGWHMLRQRGVLRERRLRRVRLGVAALAIALVSGALGYALARPAHVEPLAYSMSGLHLELNGTLRVDSQQGGHLRFSEGSMVRLHAGTVARLVRVASDDVRLRVNEGTFEGAIEASGDAHVGFEFDLGAYAMSTRDAAFVARLSQHDELLEVRVFSGLLELDGPLASDGLTLRGGQVLTIRRSDGAIIVRDATSDDLAGESDVEAR
jgi:hypothetical protein